MKKLITICLFVSLLPVAANETQQSSGTKRRDPFLPIGYVPEAEREPVEPEPEVDPDNPPPITDEELMKLAREESDRISESFKRRATMITNGKIYAHVGESNIVSRNPWVTQGDYFVVEVRGERYRMKVVKLTRSQIQLEPQRMTQAP